MSEAVDFVAELTKEIINWSTLEELSNIDKLTPVFLFSGYVGYPNETTIPYDKMKAYFTHDDLFMHQTKNYKSYPRSADVELHEWIMINSPFTIQEIIKQQSKAYNVLDEVFLFYEPPIGEIEKCEEFKFSHIDFDEIRFSRSELLALFDVKKSYSNAQNEFQFYLDAAKTLRDSVKADDNIISNLIEPIGSQRLLVSYALFTPHQIICLLSNDNPAYNHNDDEYNAYKDMVSNAIEAKALNPINDKEQIPAEQVKIWLARYNFVLKGFNDNLSNTDSRIGTPTISQTEPKADNQIIEQLRKKITVLATENDKLNKQLSKQADAPADDNILQTILDESHEHYAPDLKHAIQLWSDLYINGMIGTDSHSNKADIWISSNTPYGNNSEDSSVKRLRQVSTPLKDFGGQRKR